VKPGDLVKLKLRGHPQLADFQRDWLRHNLLGRTMLVVERVNTGHHFLVNGEIYYLDGAWDHCLEAIDETR
jgi:hypothetical protein